ncbi:ABC transporter ATP-binding protein [Verminephrobacter eiseniae]|uniref:ABC transporter related n=1 Tax=Verminephrobacter eiseniae (strain EF01-2) TaxID=391735 RepID=A1WPI7_VEREI|nr:ABC transporter ATP-binding protein [Verminephrobacter eiseniae]ABM59544.1 ABC transporter related [Verminephrobacter eiseniae EF01-2]
MKPILQVQGLVAGYGNIEAVHGVSLDVAAGECVALIGPNGAGKSTLLKAICGLVEVTGGDIIFDGHPLRAMPGSAIAALGVSMCPEGRQVFGEMSVLENLRMGAYSRRHDPAWKHDLEEMLELFPRLRERTAQKAGTLSGGEQEMLAIARALMARPRLCLLDEPSLGLAPKIVDEVERCLMAIKQRGVTMLLVEQSVSMALRVADRGYVLETGHVALSGSSASLRDNPEISNAYLGH